MLPSRERGHVLRRFMLVAACLLNVSQLHELIVHLSLRILNKHSIFAPLNRILSISLLIAFSLQSVYTFVLVMSFFAEREYIAANLCERRSDPSSCCKGMCHLSKTIDKSAKEEKKSTASLKFKIQLFHNGRNPAKAGVLLPQLSFVSRQLSANRCLGFADDVFRPPQG